MLRHFLIRNLPSERPRDAALVVISALLPSIDFGHDSVAIWLSPIQALTIQNTDFNFGHVQAARVFWGVVKYDAAQEDGCATDGANPRLLCFCHNPTDH